MVVFIILFFMFCFFACICMSLIYGDGSQSTSNCTLNTNYQLNEWFHSQKEHIINNKSGPVIYSNNAPFDANSTVYIRN
jgi:ABC-type transport system involved in multi-copper enzyme maturation permease subunit